MMGVGSGLVFGLARKSLVAFQVKGSIVEPFVGWIEGRDRYVDDAQVAYGPVAATGLQVDRGERLYGEALAIQLDFAFAFEYHVDLGHAFVVVSPAVLADVDQVHGGDRIVHFAKGATGGPAGAGDSVHLVQLGDRIVFAH